VFAGFGAVAFVTAIGEQRTDLRLKEVELFLGGLGRGRGKGEDDGPGQDEQWSFDEHRKK
jgi:hypothetical protein